MPSIDVDYALAFSQVPVTGFQATGTWDNNTAPQISCTLVNSNSVATNPSNTQANANGTWTADFGALTVGEEYELRASFAGAQEVTEPGLTVGPNNGPTVTLDPLPAFSNTRAVTFDYTVTGTYNLGTTGIGIVVMAVTRKGNKKLQSVLAAAAATLKNNGKWEATLKGLTLTGGQKLIIIADLINQNAGVEARNGRKSPKQP
jgi:hypothetical protein